MLRSSTTSAAGSGKSASGFARLGDETQQRPKLATSSPRIQYHSRRNEVEVDRQRKIAGAAAGRLGRRVRDFSLPQRPQDQEGPRSRGARHLVLGCADDDPVVI